MPLGINRLGASGGPQASAGAINNLGQVVGWAQASTDADHGFLWSNGHMTDLGLNFFPAAVNDNGVVVGGGLIYSGGTLQNPHNPVPARSPYPTPHAPGINDNRHNLSAPHAPAPRPGHALSLPP